MTHIKLVTDTGKTIRNFGNVSKEYIEEVYNELPDSFRNNEQVFKMMKAFI